MMGVEERIAELGLVLPVPAAPVATYVPFVRAEGLLHVSGQIPFDVDGSLVKGIVGGDIDVARGRYAAERCALGTVAQVKAALGGSFGGVERFVKLGVFVACPADFTEQPEVANGASDLIVALFGDAGRHARSAVGVSSLPRGVAVEVDAIVQLR
jgi:enamine deaminase RidA (YjgF/YER057c/UK114 family)